MRQKINKPTPKHMRQLTTWQVLCQVEEISQPEIEPPLPRDLGVSPSSSISLRSSRTDLIIVLVSLFFGCTNLLFFITLFRPIAVFCESGNIMRRNIPHNSCCIWEIFHIIMSVPHNTTISLNNVMFFLNTHHTHIHTPTKSTTKSSLNAFMSPWNEGEGKVSWDTLAKTKRRWATSVTLKTKRSRGPSVGTRDPVANPATWPVVPRGPHSSAYT